MHIQYDDDEFETVVISNPCTACNGDRTKCHGQCNGSVHYGSKRRDPTEVQRIKAERERKREDEVLAEADAIRARRI